MIYLGHNRDLDSVAHFWRDSLRTFLFEKREDKHRPFLRIGKHKKHNEYYDTVFSKWKGYVRREAKLRRISTATGNEVLSKLDEFEHNFDNIVLAKKKEMEKLKLANATCGKEAQIVLSYIFETLYNSFIKSIANDVLERLKIRTCPYCNRNYTFTVKSSSSAAGKKFTTRPEFDHFYSKSKHPLLALSFYNLVPSCSICNHGKATNDIGVNPYFDGFQSKFGICDKTKNVQLNINEIKRTKSKDDFSVGFVNPSKNEKQNIDGLGLAVLYDKHKDYVMDLIEKSTSYGSLEQNQALSDAFQGLFRTPQEVYDFVWGKYLNEEELENRPLSKLTRDILEQLGIV